MTVNYPSMSDWNIDRSTGRPILVYQGCRVIEAEQAEYVLRLIQADRATRVPHGMHVVNVCPICDIEGCYHLPTARLEKVNDELRPLDPPCEFA